MTGVVLQIALVAAGGAIGAVGRYALGLGAVAAFGAGFPWGILIANVLGSALIGIVIVLTQALGPGQGDAWRLFLAVGLLGGFTTFSSFSLDVALMLEQARYLVALAYVGLSVSLCVVGAVAGLAIGRAVFVGATG
ncbi:MAG: CrcB family protein [Pseudomonadota bacterium]